MGPFWAISVMISACGLFMYLNSQKKQKNTEPVSDQSAKQDISFENGFREHTTAKKPEIQTDKASDLQTKTDDDMIEEVSYIQEMKHIQGSWQQYDFLLAARPYGWMTMIDWAAYMETSDLDNISTLTVAEMANMPETELIDEYRSSGVSLAEFDRLSDEAGMLAIGGISRTLRMPVKIVWFNQTRVMRIFTLSEDETLLRKYAETVIRRTFGTKDAMKLARPVVQKEKPEHTRDKRTLIIETIKEAGFSRPDPGPAMPGSYDHGSSYERVYGQKIKEEFHVTRVDLFDLGCITSTSYDGKRDCVSIDVLSGEPWYIVSSQNGGVADFFIYGGKPVSYELVRSLAKASGHTEFEDISESNWLSKLPEKAQKMREELLCKIDEE